MSSFSALKTAIQAAIKQNGNNAITGDILQEILLSIVSTLGDSAINNLETGLQTESQTRGNDDAALSQAIENEATARGNQDTQLGNLITGIKNNIDNGYVYAGIATPSTTPVSGRVFYIAQIAGTYTNFGNLNVTQGINILKYNGSVWSLDAFIGIDNTLTPSSNNLPKSGNVLENIIKNGSAFDLTAYNNGTTYADLSAALTALDGLQAIYKQPGMSFRFVQSFDNKYVRYNLIANEFTTDTTQWAIDDGGVYVENPEFVEVKTDSEGKILWAIKVDGNIYYGVGVPQQVIDYIQQKIDELSLDEYEVIVSFLDGLEEGDKTLAELLAEKVDKEEGKSLIDADYANGISYVENPEFTAILLDHYDRILFGIKQNGDFYFGYGVPTQIVNYVNSKKAEILAEVQTSMNIALATKVDKVTGKGLIQNEVSESLSAIEDPEGRSEITTDNESKIISYRDSNGVKHEEVGFETERVKTNHLVLTESGMNEFQQALINAGFNPTGISDWSAKTELHIGEPYCAIVNFSGINVMPTTKTDNAHAYLEFWDMNGNYFKKEVIANAQGRSTMNHPKKNIAIDICNNNGWDDDDTFKLQIGDWVPQDSFHLKAFYNDPFRCLSPVAYKLNDEILKTRGEHNDYVWKRGLFDLSDITATSTGCEDAEEAIESWNSGARCFPMGFPCIVYLNGEFYGIYSWQLKKHRDNYMMSKKKTKHIHLDGIISTDRILNANGDPSKIWWTTDSPEGIEIRNPKPKKKKDGWDLVKLDGTKYDADANGGELMSPTMIVEGEEVANPNWDANDVSHTKSYEVKQYILNMSKIWPTIVDAWNTYTASAGTAEDKAAFKTVFETYLDVNNLIDYLILSDVLANYDGFSQNVQWITYDGVKWYLCAYDLDGVMGNYFQLTDHIVEPKNQHYNYIFFIYLPVFYGAEMTARYKELRDMSILTPEHICGLVTSWMDRLGNKETFDKEWEKWPGFIKNDNIHRLYKWLQTSISNMDSVYHYNQD